MRTWDVSRDGVWPGECDDGNGREVIQIPDTEKTQVRHDLETEQKQSPLGNLL